MPETQQYHFYVLARRDAEGDRSLLDVQGGVDGIQEKLRQDGFEPSAFIPLAGELNGSKVFSTTRPLPPGLVDILEQANYPLTKYSTEDYEALMEAQKEYGVGYRHGIDWF